MPIPPVSLPGKAPEFPELFPGNLYHAAVLLEPAGDFADSQWNQGAKARDADHRPTGLDEYRSSNRPAVRYCAVGHGERVCQETRTDSAYQSLLLTWLAREVQDSIPRGNDEPGRTPKKSGNFSAGFRPGSTGKPPPKSPAWPPSPPPPAPAQTTKEALPTPAPAR